MDSENKTNVGTLERGLSVGLGSLLAFEGVRRRSVVGGIQALLGTALLLRGTSGRCPLYKSLGFDTRRAARGKLIQEEILIHRDPQTLYKEWRNLSNLPRYMKHIKSVTEINNSRSHWVTDAPLGQSVEWDAEIVEDSPGHHIAWRSVPGSLVSHSGAVGFTPTDNGSSTQVHVSLQYTVPGGILGEGVVRLVGDSPANQISIDLKGFKEAMELN